MGKISGCQGQSLVSSLCTMDSHIIFNPGTVERLTPGRFAFTRAPGPAGPHPAPVSKSQHNLQGGRELEQCRGAFCHDSGFSFLLFFSLTPLCENIIASFSLGRNFPLSFFFMLHERAGGGVCLWAFFMMGQTNGKASPDGQRELGVFLTVISFPHRTSVTMDHFFYFYSFKNC